MPTEKPLLDRRRAFMAEMRKFAPPRYNARRMKSTVVWDSSIFPDVLSLSNWIRGIIARGFEHTDREPMKAYEYRVRRQSPGVYLIEFVEQNDWTL